MNNSLLHRFPRQMEVFREDYRGECFRVRLTDHTDYQLVMSVSDGIYDGLDYLPAKYHWLLDTGNVLGFLFLLGSKPIGYQAIYRFSDEYIVGLAARMLPQYAASGLFAFIMVKLNKFIVNSQIFSENVKIISVGAVNAGRQRFLDKIQRPILHNWNTLVLELADLSISSPITPPTPVHVTLQQLTSIFNKAENLSVFPSGYFAAERPKIPYQANKENILRVYEHNHVHVTYLDQSANTITAISFAHTMNVPYGRLLELFYYGAINVDTMRNHIIAVIKFVQQKHVERKACKFILYYPDGFDLATVEEIVQGNKLGERKRQSAYWCTNFITYSLDSMNVFGSQSKL